MTQRRYIESGGQEFALRRGFALGVGFCLRASDCESKGVELVENTHEEIRDVVVEMAERLNGTWQPHEDDKALQKRFRGIFPADALEVTSKRPLRGEIRGRFGAAFRRNNCWWFE
jgi:hypothetical protein